MYTCDRLSLNGYFCTSKASKLSSKLMQIGMYVHLRQTLAEWARGGRGDSLGAACAQRAAASPIYIRSSLLLCLHAHIHTYMRRFSWSCLRAARRRRVCACEHVNRVVNLCMYVSRSCLRAACRRLASIYIYIYIL